MRFAVLGVDSQVLEIARAIVRSPEHQLAWLAESGETGGASLLAGDLSRLAPHARLAETWEMLLDDNLVDAVVVAAGDEDLRAEQLRKFVQIGIPLLVSHPVVDSMLVYFEIDMIRRETASILVPYLPDRWHPGVAVISEAFRLGVHSPIGHVEQVVLERQMHDRSRQAVRWQFARDVDTLRVICGDILRLGAMGGVADSASAAGLGVQMSGLNDLLMRWSVAPTGEAGLLGRLTLFGASGRLELTMHGSDKPWTLLTVSGDHTETTTYPDWDPARAAIAQLEGAGQTPAASTWPDAARSIELMETIDRSLKRGRTIDLHREEYSEQGTFKGLMASAGCGLLIAGLLLLMGIALVEDIARVMKVRIPLIDKWPYILLALLGVFLAMQLFSLLFKGDRNQDRPR